MIRSALFLPASNPRAVARARELDADLVILDLEDAVAPEQKHAARASALEALEKPFRAPVAVRLNGLGTPWHDADLAAVAGTSLAYLVLPKVEMAEHAAQLAERAALPVIAMIESPAGVLSAPAIAAAPGVSALMAGTNDLAHALRLSPGEGRAGLALALQQVVLAARAAGVLAIDGVHNRLDDPAGFEIECREGRSYGFDGKSLIHPNQIAGAHAAFAPSAAELEDARALVAAASGGAERFRGRMVEAMHVDAARRLLVQAERDQSPGGPR